MKFERTEEYMGKLFALAMFDEKRVVQDATVTIEYGSGNKMKAYCEESKTYLQFPRALRTAYGREFTADVVEVIRDDGVAKYYRAMKGSIRDKGKSEVLA
jgi:hypothetical protein